MEILGGVALAFAIPAFALCVRTMARVKDLEQRLSLLDGHAKPK